MRCECGERFAAQFNPPRSPAVLRCSGCGAHADVDAKACGYCGAQMAMEDRGISSVCPGCWARMTLRARFCPGCGLEIQPQALIALPESSRCPACAGKLRQRDLGEISLVECAGCAGLWITTELLEELCLRADRPYPELLALFRQLPKPEFKLEHPVVYRACPVCNTLMLRRRFARKTQVVLDCCSQHGLWLDHGELELILNVVRAGGAPQRISQDRREAAIGPESRDGPRWSMQPRPTRSLRERGWDLYDLLGEIAWAILTHPR